MEQELMIGLYYLLRNLLLYHFQIFDLLANHIGLLFRNRKIEILLYEV